MSNELSLSASAMSVQDIVNQREMITSLMKSAMKEGMDYGKIPGCGDKPSLFQPGAQKMGFLFRIRSEYDIIEKELPGDHREYRIICRLWHMPSNSECSQGVGICSTMEGKYRYRNAAREVKWLDQPVPPVYWNLRRKEGDGLKNWMQTVFGDRDVSNIGTKKNDKGEWYFVEFFGGEGKTENANIADVFNTVLKMAKKRAYVDAIITTTASNDMFTQDLEDIADNITHAKDVTPTEPKPDVPGEGKTEKPDDKAKADSAPAKEPEAKTEAKRESKADTLGWRQVKCHLGTVGGKINGRLLGELSGSSLGWIVEQLAKKKTKSKTDEELIAALEMWKAEAAVAAPDAKPSLDLLHKKCQALKLSLGSIVEVNKELGGTAETFLQISENEAKYLLAEWKQTEERARFKMDQIPN